MELTYDQFLEQKRHSGIDYGIKPTFLPTAMFDFQKYVAEYAINKGRCAVFLDTGLGKTIIELVIATNYVRSTNKPVLIITPLAVAFQFIKEAEKFGIDDISYSKDGHFTTKIVVCNYERLAKFNAEDFDCVILDECFAPDTKMRIVRKGHLMNVYIKDCLVGDKVLNCTGLDTVKAVKRKKINYAIKIKFNGQSIISSPRHPYLTQRGWVAAKELQPTDYIVSTDKAMRILRGDISTEMENRYKETVLHNILLSEMEDEPAGIPGKCSQSRSSSKKRQKPVSMAENACGGEGNRTHTKFESDVKLRDQEKGIRHIEKDEVQTFGAWGKWNRNDVAAAINEGCIVEDMGGGLSYISGKTTKGLSDKLQSRFGKLRNENCNRTRWQLPLQQKASGRKERQQTDFFRVESFEVLEQGCAELDRYKDETGALYFYDLEIERHPSFTINNGLVHNSSILKNFDGAIKGQITSFIRKTKYRYLFTATPSPNDYIELGTSSEALGYLGYTDMLTKFFKNNNNSIDIRHAGSEWYLKAHAEKDFWHWIKSWSISMRRPSDLGFNDDLHNLPELIETETIVTNTNPLTINGQPILFAMPAKNFFEIKAEVRATIDIRCQMAVDKASQHDTSVYWVNLNNEAEIISRLDKNAVEIKGKMDIDEKEEILVAFSNQQIKKLITKTSITAFGLNWQHCNHTVYFPTYSYEQYYQAIRRFWRFGQKNSVLVDLILSDGQTRVMESLMIKKNKAVNMFENISKQTNTNFVTDKKLFNSKIQLPKFISK